MIKYRTSFTLIELLVVISIISVLSSMLLPALSKAKRKAYDTQGANRLKQLSVAGFYYADDWDQVLPHNGGSSSYQLNWLSSTSYNSKLKDTYLSGDRIPFTCPFAQGDNIGLPNFSDGTDHHLNPYLGGRSERFSAEQSKPKFKQLTSEAFWIGDGPIYSNFTTLSFISHELYPQNVMESSPTGGVPWIWNETSNYYNYVRGKGHGNGTAAQFVFGDTHVETLTGEQARSPYASKTEMQNGFCAFH